MGKRRANKSELRPAEIRRFKSLLLSKRNEILSNVLCMEDETLHRMRTDLSNVPFHMADIGSDNYELENTLGLMDSERKLLVEIEDALGRIEDGSYGICENENEPIPKARLNAIPWARYCVACANLSEKGLLVGGESVGGWDNVNLPTDYQKDDFDDDAL